ncbi:endonuclease/exonuclease/phosphatase family protein [Nonomuraea sp. NPDC046570]|uniref:endonuclease/exonuclease/phosphatase family protein n=1 Tax=Nonomuraea sp. NPDC046570 TaxID=3155255 RepID=UPI0033EE8DED
MSITTETKPIPEDAGARRPRRRGRWLSWTVTTFFALWAIVRVGGLEQGSFPTQLMTMTPYAVVLALLTALLVVRRNRPAAAVALAACLALAATVAPRAFSAPADSVHASSGTPQAAGAPLRVLTVNLFGRADAQAVVKLVREYRPDVFSALELTPESVTELDAAGLGTLMPHRVLQADWGATGSGLFAKHPLAPLDDLFTPIGHNMPAATLTLPAGERVQVAAIHPNPPLGRMEAEWNAALDAFPSASPDVIRVLAGDFNASLDHRAMRDLLDRGYADAADQVGKGLVPTWPNGRKIPPIITIDHVLADRRVSVTQVEILDVPGTDHRGVFADLRLPSTL